MRSTNVTKQLIAALAATALVAAACGSDDGAADDGDRDGADVGDESADAAAPVVYEPVIDLGTEPFEVDLTGIEEPLSDNFIDEPLDPTEPSLTGLRVYFDLGYPDADWRIAMATSESTSFGKAGNEWSIRAANYGEADPVDVCEAALGYFRPFDEAARVVVELMINGADNEPLARAESGESCVAI